MDYERVLLGVKRHLATKSHHGQRELAAVIAQLEVENTIEEGLPDRMLRLYGLEFFEEAIRGAQPRSERGRVPAAEGNQDRAPRGDSSPESEEDIHGRSNGSDGHAPSGRSASGSRGRAGRERALATAHP